MGTDYYFLRRDTDTLFAFDKAYGLREVFESLKMIDHDGRITKPERIAEALDLWATDSPRAERSEMAPVALALENFAGGQALYFIDENHPLTDELYNKYNSMLERITHSRFSQKPDYVDTYWRDRK